MLIRIRRVGLLRLIVLRSLASRIFGRFRNLLGFGRLGVLGVFRSLLGRLGLGQLPFGYRGFRLRGLRFSSSLFNVLVVLRGLLLFGLVVEVFLEYRGRFVVFTKIHPRAHAENAGVRVEGGMLGLERQIAETIRGMLRVGYGGSRMSRGFLFRSGTEHGGVGIIAPAELVGT